MDNRILVAMAASIVIATAGATAEEGPDADHDAHGGMAMMAGVGEPGRAEDVARTVVITAIDNLFEPESLEIAAGETVRFVVTNEGELVHEFNIGTAAMHAEHQEEMAMMVEHGVIEIDHINHDMMNVDMGGGHVMGHDYPNAALLEPGQAAEIIWKFTDGGHLEFACNLPGHYDAGMMGRITVTH